MLGILTKFERGELFRLVSSFIMLPESGMVGLVLLTDQLIGLE